MKQQIIPRGSFSRKEVDNNSSLFKYVASFLLKFRIYTQIDSKVGFWKGSGANFCVWSERPLLNSKARVKTKNLLPS